MTSITSLSVLVALSLPQLPNVEAVLQSIHQSQAEARMHLKPGEKLDSSVLNAEIEKKASKAVAGVDPSKIPADQAEAWSELYRFANREDDSQKLSEKSVNISP